MYFKKNEIETFMADPEHYSGSEPDWYIYAKGKVESNNDITLYPASWYKSGINEDNKKQTVTLKFN